MVKSVSKVSVKKAKVSKTSSRAKTKRGRPAGSLKSVDSMFKKFDFSIPEMEDYILVQSALRLIESEGFTSIRGISARINIAPNTAYYRFKRILEENKIPGIKMLSQKINIGV